MNYLKFLTLLASLGSKLPDVIKALQALAEWYATYVQTLIPASRKLKAKAAKKLTAKELKAEQAVLTALAIHGNKRSARAIGDGSLLKAIRALWDFVQANPALMALVLNLLGL